MIELPVLKEKLRAFYDRYDAYVAPTMKFFLVFTTFHLLNQNIGFIGELRNPMVPLLLGVISALLPYGAITFLAAVFMLFRPYGTSFEMALVVLTVLVIVGILYCGFQPGDSYLLLIAPVLFFLEMPYVVPLLVGLSRGLVSVIPVSCGIFFSYAIQRVKQSVGILANDASVDVTQEHAQMTKALFNNQLVVMVVAALAVGILVIYVICILPMDYAWWAAIIAGTVAQVAAVFVGNFVPDISIPMGKLLFGATVSVGVTAIYTFFAFAVDYSRTEYLQYEDDDYHYYVKAVPKIVVSAPDVKMQETSARRGQRNMRD